MIPNARVDIHVSITVEIPVVFSETPIKKPHKTHY